MYNAAVIGLGKIGLMYDFEDSREVPSSHVLSYQLNPETQLVASADTRQEQREFLQKIAPTTSFYTDTQVMVGNHPIDILSICTPPQQRLDLIKMAVEVANPKVIFCEKPVAKNVEEALQLVSFVQSKKHRLVFIPNLSRRWNSEIRNIMTLVQNRTLGSLEKIHARYTRGIYNTGSHLFDLMCMFAGSITEVQVMKQVITSSDKEDEPTFSFAFHTENGVYGFADAFNDKNYYMFEIDLYFEHGKIEIRNSGDVVRYCQPAPHPLFAGFSLLKVEKEAVGLLSESNLKNAVSHIVNVLNGVEVPICDVMDGVYPLFVAEALLRSYKKHGSREKVTVEIGE